MNEITLKRMKTLASRSDGDRPWSVFMDWGGNLNEEEIAIVDFSGRCLFKIVGGSLDHASYIVSLNNIFVRENKQNDTVQS